VKLDGLSVEEASELTGQSAPLVKVKHPRGLAMLSYIVSRRDLRHIHVPRYSTLDRVNCIADAERNERNRQQPDSYQRRRAGRLLHRRPR